MEVQIVDVKPQTVLGIRKRGKYDMIPQMLGEIVQFAMARGVPLSGMPTFVCHENGPEEVERANAAGNADVEVAFPVAHRVEGSGDIKCYTLPGGKMARIVHKGAYKDCGPTYERLFAWMVQNGKMMNGPVRELYLNDPRVVPESELLTEIYAPIE